MAYLFKAIVYYVLCYHKKIYALKIIKTFFKSRVQKHDLVNYFSKTSLQGAYFYPIW